MRIGIISDTHLDKELDKFDYFIREHLNSVDLIIHGGDYKSKEVIEKLKDFKDFVGVWGNVDGEEVKKEVPEKQIINVGKYKIGIYHGHGKGKTTLDRAYEAFLDTKVNIIIFGHSHQPIIKTKNGILIINPGSATRKRKESWFSYGILEIHDEEIKAELKFFDKKGMEG